MQTRSLAILLILCTSLAGGVQAASLLEAPSGSADGRWLPVMVSGISQATSVQFDLRYDPGVVTLDGIQLASAYADASMTLNTNEAGRARVLVIFSRPRRYTVPGTAGGGGLSAAGGGSSSLTLEDARWSDFPAFPRSRLRALPQARLPPAQQRRAAEVKVEPVCRRRRDIYAGTCGDHHDRWNR